MIRKVPLLAWMPTLMVAVVYCSWAVAYAQLGRRPRPSMDDPLQIGGVATDVHAFCAWTIRILVAIWGATFLLRLVRADSPGVERRNGRLQDFINGLIAIGLPFSLLVLHDAIVWFID